VDARLLSRYFDDFVRRGIVPDVGDCGVASDAPADGRAVVESSEALRNGLGELLGKRVRVGRISLAPLETEESIVAELTAWRSGGGTESGLFHAGVEAIGDDGLPRDVRLFVKAKLQDTQSIDVAVALAGLASPTLRDEVHRFRDDLGLSRSHLRELAIYQLDDAGIRAHTPRPVLIERDDSRRRWVVVLESIADAALINANDPARWDDESIDAALAGLASIHSAWLGRTSELMRQPWLVARDERKWIELAPLWRELARHAHVRSTAFAAPRLRRIHDELVEDVASWVGVLASLPQTLIHNDFNPRNIALRSDSGGLRLCVFDWELATIGAPQRDLAEFLSFVLPPDASPRTIARWVERSRALLVAESGLAFPPMEWETGFRAALGELLVDRLSFYAMIDRVRSQVFLGRVVQSWLNIFGWAAGRV
jgi:hypothetical protein